MALIKCIECGEEISDKAERCPKCGCPVKTEENNNENLKKQEKNKKVMPVIIAVVAVAAVIAIVFIVKGISTKKNYEQAIELMEEGKNQEAYDKFVKLKGYKESDKYAEELYEVITYEKAMDCLSDGEFTQAIDMLKEIPDYPDAKKMLDLMTSKYPNVSDDTYFVGMYILSVFNSSDYEDRIGNQLKACIDSNFGDRYSETPGNEVMDALKKEEYIIDMVELINSIPESGGADSDFKDLILALYKVKLDGIFANYIDGDNEYNSTTHYQLVLMLLGINDEDFYDLYDLVDEGQEYLSSGQDDISELCDLFQNIADCTMFSGIDE